MQIMAEIFQDLLCNREDYLRALRALLREIMRAVRQDFNFLEFSLGLMAERTEVKFRDMDPQFKVCSRHTFLTCIKYYTELYIDAKL